MTTPDIFAVIEATWPPQSHSTLGKWKIRTDSGGGKRVSAASALGPVDADDIDQAEARMKSLDQPLLFSLKSEQQELDVALAERRYAVIDPTVMFHCPVCVLTAKPVPPVTAFSIWPPLQIMNDIWAQGGIGPARQAVMNRVKTPKTAILGRINARAAGTAFVALHSGTAMVHAVEVLPDHRRHGLARYMMIASAHWAQDHGATDFALVTTKANIAARALYSSLGMAEVGQYHYRMKL